MKKIKLLVLSICMMFGAASCSVGPTITANGTMTLGGSFLAKAKTDARQATNPQGVTLTWVRTKPDETGVAKTALGTIGGIAAANALADGYKSANALEGVKSTNALEGVKSTNAARESVTNTATLTNGGLGVPATVGPISPP